MPGWVKIVEMVQLSHQENLKILFNFFNLLQVQKVQFQKSRGYLRKDKYAT